MLSAPVNVEARHLLMNSSGVIGVLPGRPCDGGGGGRGFYGYSHALFEVAANIADACQVVGVYVLTQAVDDVQHGCGACEVGGADGDGCRACQDELQSVAGGRDAADADTGTETALQTCQTMRTAMGRMAGPDMPPVMVPVTVVGCRRR